MTREAIAVDDYDVLQAQRDLTDRERKRIADVLGDGVHRVVWVPDWLLDANHYRIQPVDGTRRVFGGQITKATHKAWRVAQDQAAEYLPRSAVFVFERSQPVDVDVPQGDLTDFVGGQA